MDFNLFGNYKISSGDYLFVFQNIINKRFQIDAGSSIKWNGDPYEAVLDISARYKLKANLGSLGVQSSDSSRSIPVECVIKITDELSNPGFNFSVDLPTLSEFEKSPYLSAINQNLNNNFITLLLVNSFYGSGGSGITTGSMGGAGLLGKTASEVLSNQLSNWLSQISKNVDIGINYRQGANLSQEEVQVALSTQLFNDRVTIESNLGVNTNQNAANTKSSNQIVGDLNIEIKINNALRFKVFNKTNDYDVLQYISPYTQGIGIFYRKEFDNLKGIIRKKKNKEKTPKN